METKLIDPLPPTGLQEQLVAVGPPRERPAGRVHAGGMARSERDLREALSGFLTGAGSTRPVRAEIAKSWQRVASPGSSPSVLIRRTIPSSNKAAVWSALRHRS